VCQAGLGETAKARAAFEKYLKEYPNEKADVAKVQKSIRELEVVGRPAPPLRPAGWLGGALGSDGLKAVEGQAVVLVWFATWCPNCRKELAHLRAILKKWEKSDVVFIGIADPDDPQSTMPVEDYVRTNKLEFFDVGLDKTSSSWAPYRVTGFPAAALIDRKGIVRWRGHLAFFPNPLLTKVLKEGS
jgi:thiol-disulfide isomerase/thioredoxin